MTVWAGKFTDFKTYVNNALLEFKWWRRKESEFGFYKVMAVPELLYKSEAWTLKEQDIGVIQVGELEFIWSVKGYI